MQAGFYDDVIPSNVLDRVAGMTSDTGDLRVGIDLLRRAGLENEADARITVTIEDIESAHEKSMSVHLSRRLNGLSQPEIVLVRVIIELEGSRAGDVFEAFEEETGLQYTRFSELVNKLDRSGIINAAYGDSNQQGRSRKLTTTYSLKLIEDGIED